MESDNIRHDWLGKCLCHKQMRYQTTKDMTGGKMGLNHKQTRDQMIKDVIGGKRVNVISRQEIRL